MDKKMKEKITDLITFLYLAVFIVWILSMLFGKIQVSSIAVVWLLFMTGVFCLGKGSYNIYLARKIRKGTALEAKIDSLVYWYRFSAAPVFVFSFGGQKLKKESIRKRRVFSEKKLLGKKMVVYYNMQYPDKVTFGEAGSELALNICLALTGAAILALCGVLVSLYFVNG